MEKTENNLHNYGLVGKNIAYSFSPGYFTEKFKLLQLNKHKYVNFDLENINEFTNLIKNTKNLKGLNVTIPYKEVVMPFMDALDPEAEQIGAVNTVKFKNGKLIGYNTDVYGFKESLLPHLKKHHKKALILGTGGASKAVAFVLKQLGINFVFVSRTAAENRFTYTQLTEQIIKEHTVLVNCTPLGTSPNIEEHAPIPYPFLTDQHLLFDLIYNPAKTTFLRKGENQGAAIANGKNMLALQAEKSWEIWNR